MAQTLVESQAVFKERAQRVGLPESARDRLIAQGVDTLAKLAFASGNPGEAPTEATLKQLIEEQGKPAPSVGAIAAVRHLVFEAQTVLVSQTKAMTETREEVKELAPAERRARVRDQATRLKGIPVKRSFATTSLRKSLTSKGRRSLSSPKSLTKAAARPPPSASIMPCRGAALRSMWSVQRTTSKSKPSQIS